MARRIKGIWYPLSQGMLVVPAEWAIPVGYREVRREQSTMGIIILCKEVG